MRVACDIDGVVLDTLGGVKKALEKDGISFNPQGVTDYSFKTGSYGCDRSDVIRAITHPDVINGLEPYEDAVLGLEMMRHIASIDAYTSVEESCLDHRVSALKALGFSEDEIHVFNGSTGKSKPFVDGYDVLIEDCPDVINLWLSSGFEGTILVRRHNYNKDMFNDIKNVFYFEDLVKAFFLLEGWFKDGILR